MSAAAVGASGRRRRRAGSVRRGAARRANLLRVDVSGVAPLVELEGAAVEGAGLAWRGQAGGDERGEDGQRERGEVLGLVLLVALGQQGAQRRHAQPKLLVVGAAQVERLASREAALAALVLVGRRGQR